MKRLGLCALLFGALVSVIAAQSRNGGADGAAATGSAAAARAKTGPAARPGLAAPRATVTPVAAHAKASATAAAAPAAQQVFEKYCSDCHTGARAKANIDFDKLTAKMTPESVAEKADIWD